MEPDSNQSCTTPFPFYELHQLAHNTRPEITTPSAMDILCEIVNSEYSDIGYNMAPPAVVGISSHGGNHQSNIEKESFLDILYSSGSKAMEIVDSDVEMIHEQHPTYNIHFSTSPTSNSMAAQHAAFSSPDMHHFKLPLLEQEPETSITNSQTDEKLKHKEIRRNLERSILMQQASGTGPGCQPSLGSMPSSKGEVKRVEKHEMSSSSNPMLLCDGYEYVGGAMVDKVSSSSARPYNVDVDDDDDDDDEDKKMECNGRVDEARSSVRPYFDDAKQSKKKASARCINVDYNETNTNSVARVKHVVVEKSSHANAHMNGGELDAEVESHVARIKRLSSVPRVESAVIETGQRKQHVENSLVKNGHKRARVESPAAAGASDGAEETISCGKVPRMSTHISVERNRRKQMNEHLAILRSLMPTSYVQRSDQASIIGGVVEFIKELQQLLTSLETQKRRRTYAAEAMSPRVSAGSGGPSPRGSINANQLSPRGTTQELVATSRSALADVEVKLAGGAHVLLRTLSHKATHGQLLHLIAALECMSLEILHLNITTLQQAVLYTFTLKIGIECRLSVDDLADVGQQIFKDIHARRL